MRRFWISRLGTPGEQLALDPQASHHLVHVLRATKGQAVVVFDGAGAWAQAMVETPDATRAVVRQVGPTYLVKPTHPLVLLLGLAKADAMNTAVRMATESGATALQPVQMARSIPKKGRIDRWKRIATAAAAQCGRADRPQVLPVRSLADALHNLPQGIDLRVADPGAGPLPRATGPAAVVVGPEGGLTGAERAQLAAHGARTVGLGAWTLRVDTAVAVALGLTAP